MPLFHPYWHFAFDLLAYFVSTLLFRAGLRRASRLSPALERRGYWVALLTGALAGAFLFGSWNLSLRGITTLAHSVAGAIAGGILGAELYKWRTGIRGSTGALFALPLAAGIATGRLGCFFAGLPDETYGVPTALPWGVNFGDGIARHPVQLYEAAAMALCAFALAFAGSTRPAAYRRYAFFAFTAFYGAQRFCWEFLKPYPKVWGPLNLFHFLCAALFAYAAGMAALAKED